MQCMRLSFVNRSILLERAKEKDPGFLRQTKVRRNATRDIQPRIFSIQKMLQMRTLSVCFSSTCWKDLNDVWDPCWAYGKKEKIDHLPLRLKDMQKALLDSWRKIYLHVHQCWLWLWLRALGTHCKWAWAQRNCLWTSCFQSTWKQMYI